MASSLLWPLCYVVAATVLSSLQLLKTFALMGSGQIVIVVSTSPSSKVEDWRAEMCGVCIDHLRCGNGGWQRQQLASVCVTETLVGVGRLQSRDSNRSRPPLVIVLLELKSSKDPHS